MKLTRRRRFWLNLLALDTALLTGRGDETKTAWAHVKSWQPWRWLVWLVPSVAAGVTVWMWWWYR